MLSPSQQKRFEWLENTNRTPSEEEEYQILRSHQWQQQCDPRVVNINGEDAIARYAFNEY